jgi:hypothetical protein
LGIGDWGLGIGDWGLWIGDWVYKFIFLYIKIKIKKINFIDEINLIG